MKKYSIFLLIAIILLVCTNQFGKDEFNVKIANLEHSLKKEDWVLAKKQMDDLSSYYDNNLWKVQLVGGEAEYKDLYETISRLTILIEEEDRTDSRMELETVKTLVEHIYSF
jgi:PBP1b-binding outer membrane lipoprotein LpoB